MHVNIFKLAILHTFSDKNFESSLSGNSYCNTIGKSSVISSATRMVCPFLKLNRSVLLVMYSWINGIHCETNRHCLALLWQ